MKTHFKTKDQAQEVGYYFMHDIIANVKAMSVLFHQYELLHDLELHELKLLQDLNNAVISYEIGEVKSKLK